MNTLISGVIGERFSMAESYQIPPLFATTRGGFMSDDDILDAYERNGRNAAAALRELTDAGKTTLKISAFKDRLAKLAREGRAPGHFDNGTAPGYLMGKVTVQRGPTGDVERTWERQSPDQQRWLEACRVAAEAMAAELPRAEPVSYAAGDNPGIYAAGDNLCTVYTLTDAHIGMLAWHREGGADWDLRIAENTIVGCFAEAIRGTPASKVAVLNQLGDLLHHDGLLPVTPTSGHVLDADGRFTKMVEVAVRVLRRVIDMLLAKHASVHLILAEGNHDIAGSVWLRTMFKALYEKEPRITVDDSALPYYSYRHGETLLAFHHSHLKKNAQLPLLIAAQFASDWGVTRHRYIHTGNLHHRDEKEYTGAVVIQHPTLAARDAYAARGGWHAERAMDAITYHSRFGQVGRVTVSPEMLEAA